MREFRHKRLNPIGIAVTTLVLVAAGPGGGVIESPAQEAQAPFALYMDGESDPVIVPDSVDARDEVWTLFCRALEAEDSGELARALGLYVQVQEIMGASAELLARQAICHLDMREPAQAARLGQLAVEMDSLQTDGLWAAGAGLLALGELSAAVPFISRHVDLQPSSRNMTVLTNLLERLRRYDEALRPLNQLVAMNPVSPHLLERRAGLHTRLGRYDEAIADYWALLDISPEYPGLREQMTTLLKQLGRTPELISFYRAQAHKLPDDKQLRWRLVELLMNSGEWEDAEQELLTIRQAHPEDALPVLQLGLVAYRQGRVDEALERIAEAREKGVSEESALLWEMRIGFAEGNLETAIDAAKGLIEVAPETVEGWRVAGFCLADLGRPLEALSYVERWMDLEESDPEPALIAAVLCRELRAWQRGLEFAREALSRAPEDDDVRLEYAGFLEANSRIEEAAEAVDSILARTPEHPEALNFKGYMWIDHGMRLDEAEGLIKRALKHEPGNPAFLDSMGWLWYKRGDLGRAEEWLNRAISMGGRNAEIYRHLAQVVLDGGRSGEAQEILELGLKWNPRDPVLNDFLQSLEDEK